MKASQLGWVLAASFSGVAIGGGFQAKTTKIGFIDMQATYADSKLKEKNEAKLRTAERARQDAFDFFRLNPGFTEVQRNRFRELSTKDAPTPAETTELGKLKASAEAATNQFAELQKKPNPTAQDLKTLNDLGALTDANKAAQAGWGQEFTQQLRTMQTDFNLTATDAIKAALAQIAKPQGYTVVFRENVAIYGSNNLGPEVKKLVDKNAK